MVGLDARGVYGNEVVERLSGRTAALEPSAGGGGGRRQWEGPNPGYRNEERQPWRRLPGLGGGGGGGEAELALMGVVLGVLQALEGNIKSAASFHGVGGEITFKSLSGRLPPPGPPTPSLRLCLMLTALGWETERQQSFH